MITQKKVKYTAVMHLVLAGLLLLILSSGFSVLWGQSSLQQAKDFLSRSKYKEAIQILDAFIKDNPPAAAAPLAPDAWKPLAEAHYLLAKIYFITIKLDDPKVEANLVQCFKRDLYFEISEKNKLFKKKVEEIRKKIRYLEYKNEEGFLERRFRRGIVMIKVPGGNFKMGSLHGNSDEQPVHQVELNDYWIGKYEVSMGQYRQFMQQAKHRSLPRGISAMALKDTYPVIGVSWHDAVAYCQWLSQQTGQYFTLPTEAQWEKAARGTGKGRRKYPWGNQSPNCKWASYKGCPERIREVRSCSKGKSPYGAHHMAGNVYEWCRDWYAMDYYANSPNKDPERTDESNFKVFRGGSFQDDRNGLRSAKRSSAQPTGLGDFLGFRLCMVE